MRDKLVSSNARRYTIILTTKIFKTLLSWSKTLFSSTWPRVLIPRLFPFCLVEQAEEWQLSSRVLFVRENPRNEKNRRDSRVRRESIVSCGGRAVFVEEFARRRARVCTSVHTRSRCREREVERAIDEMGLCTVTTLRRTS